MFHSIPTPILERMAYLESVDARTRLPACRQVAFCFLDCEKELYAELYDQVVPSLLPGGFIAADNALSHQDYLQPIGKGVLLCRKV